MAVRSSSALAVLAGIAVSLAACGTPPPSLTFTPVRTSTPASPAAPGSPSGAAPSSSGAAPSGTGSPAASRSPAAVFGDPRRAAMAFHGTYQAQLLVIAASGSLSQDLGATHAYTWRVVPGCGGACVRATSTSHATFTLTYARGAFQGTGGGTSHCLSQSGKDVGAAFQTTLKIALQPAAPATPITSLAGTEILTVSRGCSGSGSTPGAEVIQYALTRTGG
jgi:hypothetical protein